MHSVLRNEDHPDGDAALEEAGRLDGAVHLAPATVPLPPETAPGDGREVEVARWVEDSDVRRRHRPADAHAADAPEVDRQEDRCRVLRAVVRVDERDELHDRKLARAARLGIREGPEIRDVGRELVEHQLALARLPLELVRVDEVPARAPGRCAPLEDCGDEGLSVRQEGIDAGPHRAGQNVVGRPHVGRRRRRGGGSRRRPGVADRGERRRLAEDVHADALRQDVRLQDAVDEERRVDARDAGNRGGPAERVDGVAERRLRLLRRQGERDRPDDFLDHGHVAEPAAKALLRGLLVAGRSAQAEGYAHHLLAALAAVLDRLLLEQIPGHDRSLSFGSRRFLVRCGNGVELNRFYRVGWGGSAVSSG